MIRSRTAVDLVDDPRAVDADGVVLPGVSALSEGMDNAGPFPYSYCRTQVMPPLGGCRGVFETSHPRTAKSTFTYLCPTVSTQHLALKLNSPEDWFEKLRRYNVSG